MHCLVSQVAALDFVAVNIIVLYCIWNHSGSVQFGLFSEFHARDYLVNEYK